MPSSATATARTSPLSLHDALPIFTTFLDWLQGQSGNGVVVETMRQVLGGSDQPAVPGPGIPPAPNGTNALRNSSLEQDTNGDLLPRSEEHTSELQSRGHLVCRLLLPPPPGPPLFPYTTLFRSSQPSSTGCRGNRETGSSSRRCGRYSADRISRRCRDRESRLLRTARTRSATPRSSRTRTATCCPDRKSTRLNSSHVAISYAVFCYRHRPDLPSFPTRRSSDLHNLPRLAAGAIGKRGRRRDDAAGTRRIGSAGGAGTGNPACSERHERAPQLLARAGHERRPAAQIGRAHV